MNSKSNILMTFLAACASLVVIYTLRVAEPKISYDDDKRYYGSECTLSSSIESNTYDFKEMKMDLDEEEKQIAEYRKEIDNYEEEESYDDIDTMRANLDKMCNEFDENKLNFYKSLVANFLAKIAIFILIAIITMSAYLYGAYNDVKCGHLSYKILRFSAIVPCVIFLIFKFVMKDLEHNYDYYTLEWTYNLGSVIISTAIVAIFGLKVKPQPQFQSQPQGQPQQEK